MNVTISSRLKSVSLGIATLILFFGALFYDPRTRNELDCTADINLNIGDENDKIKAAIHIVVHFVPNVRSYITEYGTVQAGTMRYVLDRYVRLRYTDSNSQAFVEFEREGIDKNSRETLPESISKRLTSAQKVFFFKVRKLHGKIWSISDLRRTILVCSKTN